MFVSGPSGRGEPDHVRDGLVLGLRRKRVDGPPLQVGGFVAAHRPGTDGCGHQEPQVEVTGGHPEGARDRMRVRRQQFRIDHQIGDAGFLGGLAQGRVDDRLVRRLAVTAELDPPPHPRMQGEQHVAVVGVEHDRRRRDVPGHVFAQAPVGRRIEERQHRVPQRFGVLGVGAPGGEPVDRRGVQGTRRHGYSSTSASPGSAGSRGSGSMSG